ncbi:hypothetical protein GYMLUDRAFT_240689 [Collybiopsis luxurians FD-317 M1]|nr:hypothetical protein GYMLUDRAFT_240689 [Collybiopsis luxurians FD-317 M1]
MSFLSNDPSDVPECRNTFLAILNSRQSLQRELHENIHSTTQTEFNYEEREISNLDRSKSTTGAQNIPTTAANDLSFTVISTDTDDL